MFLISKRENTRYISNVFGARIRRVYYLEHNKILEENMNRKEMEQAIIAHYKRLGFNNYENIVKTKTDSEIATMYYEILDEIEEYADSDIED